MIVENAEADVPSDADVCIVGAGPVGLALAFKCASQGLSVILIEAGREAITNRDETGLGTVEAINSHHADVAVTMAQGIGGTSRLWGGRCVMLDDIDFQIRDYVRFSGWPIPHSEVSAYYAEALAFLGCGPSADPAENGTSGQITSGLVESWSAEPDIRRIHGKRLRSNRSIRTYTGCTVDAIRLDSQGARVDKLAVRSKDRSFGVTAQTFVLACGGLENARLLLAAQRDWPEKFGGPDGPLGRFYCGHLTGYLAAIRFNHQSFARKLWYARNRDGSYLRRRLAIDSDTQRGHGLLNTVFWLDSFSVADPTHGSGALSMLYLGLALLGLYPRLGSGLAPSPTETPSHGFKPHLLNVRGDSRLIAGTLHVLLQLVRKQLGQRMFALLNPANRYLLRYHAEQAPHPESRAVLGHHDRAGPPPLKVDFRYQPQDIASVVRSHEILDRWLQERDVGRLDFLAEPEKRDEVVFNQALDGYHQIGLTRMSDNAKSGVVDRDCLVHDVANLFVAGSSVFPTAGQANPTLPAVALALRLADHLRRATANGHDA